MLLVHYDPQAPPAESWRRDRPKSRLAAWSGEAGRNHSGPADCTRGPEHRVGTVALGVLLPPHPGPGRHKSRAAGARSPRRFTQGTAAAARQALPRPPLHSPLPPPLPFFPPPFFPCDTSRRNLTDLTSYGEKVLSSRKTTKPTVQISVLEQAAGFPAATHLPGATGGREKMNFHSVFTFPYICTISILYKLLGWVPKCLEGRQKGRGCWMLTAGTLSW